MTEKKPDKPVEKASEELNDNELDRAQGGATKSRRTPSNLNDLEYIHGVFELNDTPLKK